LLMVDRRFVLSLLGLPGLMPVLSVHAEDRPVTVFAAASLKQVLEDVARAFKAQTGTSVVIVAAGSGELARQIEAGAPADLFIPADTVWMDWASERSLVRKESLRILAGNALVVIGPAGSAVLPPLGKGLSLTSVLGDSRLAMGDPRSVPAGRYAEAALKTLGAWDGVKDKIAATQNVRAALLLVERGEAALGIVYASDALAAGATVSLLGQFPANSHDAILYPAALTSTFASPAAPGFLDFLTHPVAQAIFEKAGFRKADAKP
jgi:molybdate transport system substrate-binding protein